MTTVKLYFRTAKSLIMADEFAMEVPRVYDEIDELWNDGAEYTLPPGYSVGENTYGERMIFDARGHGCEIDVHSSGRPQLVSAMPNMPVLRLAP